MKAANIKQVAELAQVSTATVSHVINKTRFVSEEMRQKVVAAMEALRYTPNPIARGLRSNKTYTVGLVIPVREADISSNYFMTISQGIEDVLNRQGYSLILCNTKEKEEEEERLVRLMHTKRVDGLIIATCCEKNLAEGYPLPEETRCPVVYIDRLPPQASGCDCVRVDCFGATYDATLRLLGKGHRKIAYIGGSMNMSPNIERYEGFCKALSDHGLEPDARIAFHAGKQQANAALGHSYMAQVLQHQGVTAALLANNELTIGGLRCLLERQVSIPREMAVIGFDDYEWMEITTPALSTIRQPSYELGQKAAKVLLSRIKTPKGTGKIHTLKACFVERASS